MCDFTVRGVHSARNNFCVSSQGERPSTMAPIYSPFPVRESGHLQVSSIHSIYYEDCGIATGVPIIHLHAGPGEGKVYTRLIIYSFSCTNSMTKEPWTRIDSTSTQPTTAASSSTSVALANPSLPPPSMTTQPGPLSPTLKHSENT